MVVITENLEEAEKVYKRLEGHGRAGFHVTSLIYCPRKLYFGMKGIPTKQNKRVSVITSIGKAVGRYMQEGDVFSEFPVEKDGILGSLDTITDRVVDYKTTRSKEISKKWIKQMMCYCYMSGIMKARLIVIYIFSSEVKVYDLDFTEKELLDNWNEVVKRKNYIEKCLFESKVPEKVEVEEWECNGCSYKKVCDAVDVVSDVVRI